MKTNKHLYRILLLTAVAGWFATTIVTTLAAPPKWNVVLILADDLGWKDLGCYGSDLYETPHIDGLARSGMKFTQAYSAATVCSPTRAALLTGKYPARVRITDWIPGMPPENPKLIVPDFTKQLPLEEFTLAEAFKQAGYVTANIGKWHLGGEEYYPEKHGFDVNIGGTDSSMVTSYFAPYKMATARGYLYTLAEGPPGEYLTDRLGQEAVRWLESNGDNPFFLYLPHYAPHTPIQGKSELVQKYRAKKRPGMFQTNEVYAAMIESLDDAVGAVLRKLDDLGLTERTVVIFASDNGGRVPSTSNLPLRVGKGSCYEGGTRVPFIVRWPGGTRPGSTCATPVITMDIFPTLLNIAGMSKAARKGVDGASLIPLLRETGKLKRDELFWHYPHYQHYQLGGTTPYGAIRKGDFKLLEFFDDMRVELYNLKDDIGEQNDLAAAMPKKAEQLRKRLHAWRKEVKAQMPTPSPAYDPSRPEHVPPAKRQKAGTE
jgi:arylsulfatase A